MQHNAAQYAQATELQAEESEEKVESDQPAIDLEAGAGMEGPF